MVIKKITIVSLNTLIIALSSDFATAAENTSTNASFAGWPLLLLVAVLIIFRKKIFSEVTVDQQETSDQMLAEKQSTKVTSSTVVSPPKKAPTPKKATEIKASATKDKPKTTASSIDLSNDKQCQASTTKGTRCKRTTTLEKTSLTIDNKTYQLTVCSQHNNDKFKPFPELIK